MSDETCKTMVVYLHAIMYAYESFLSEKFGLHIHYVVIPKLIENLVRLSKESNIELFKGETPQEALENLGEQFEKTQMIEKFSYVTLDEDRFRIVVGGCHFAGDCHRLLHPKDAVCAWSLLAASALEYVTGKKASIITSKFLEDGAETEIHLYKQDEFPLKRY